MKTDGGFMIVGTTSSMDGDVVGNHDHNPLWYGDVWFTKIDSTGNLLWQYCYGDIGQEYLYRGVIQKSDWDYVVALATNSDDWQCYGNTWPVVRVVELYDSTVGINETTADAINLKLYPNPAGSQLTVELPANTKKAVVEMININGITTIKKTITAPITRLNTSLLNSGLYLIKVQTQKGVTTKRVVIR